MNTLRQFCAGLILALALSASTFAGQIECGIAGPSPQETAATGYIPNGVESTDAVTDLILYILSLI